MVPQLGILGIILKDKYSYYKVVGNYDYRQRYRLIENLK
jgi:hypothetical protein